MERGEGKRIQRGKGGREREREEKGVERGRWREGWNTYRLSSFSYSFMY